MSDANCAPRIRNVDGLVFSSDIVLIVRSILKLGATKVIENGIHEIIESREQMMIETQRYE